MFQSSPELGSGPPPVAAPSSSVPAKASASSCGSLRLCSVKGCKAVIPDEYFFKICEPCRDRYRGYGTTKRAKWKRDRIAVNAELDTLRQQEDSRRATAGLPVRALYIRCLSTSQCFPRYSSRCRKQLLKNGMRGRAASLTRKHISLIMTLLRERVCVRSLIATRSFRGIISIVAVNSIVYRTGITPS